MVNRILAVLLLLVPGPALAFRAPPGAKADAKRFGLDKPERPGRPRRRGLAPQAVVRLDQLRRAGAKLRYRTSGAVGAVFGPIPVRHGVPEAAARGFLLDYREALGIGSPA
ncbi:MAG: hypothetical protein NTX64_08005 [Elusimicrobia bacterium]|nr:hypothetical protein [Elusimicrobiota bacterium]